MRASLLLPILLGCAPPPRRWVVRPDAPAAPALSPLASERIAPTIVIPPEDGAVASLDGISRTRPGPCRVDPNVPAGRDEAVVGCTFTAEREWREWRYPEPGTLLDVYDGVALIARSTAAGDVDVVRYDIDLGRASNVTLPEPTARWHRAGFTASGMLVGLARMGTEEHPRAVWVRGPSDGVLSMVTLPPEADDLAVEDEVGVCVGAAGAWAVSPVGWTRPIELPAGSQRMTDATGVRRAGERVRCAAGQCVIDGVARVTLHARSRGADPAGM